MPAEHLSHAADIHVPVTLDRLCAGLGGLRAWRRFLRREGSIRRMSAGSSRRFIAFLRHKWWFDELYGCCSCGRCCAIARAWPSWIDRRDRRAGRRLGPAGPRRSRWADDWIDRIFVDGLVNLLGPLDRTASGLWLRTLQTGNLRQYVMFIVVGTVALFVLVSLYWNFAFAESIADRR